MARKIGNNGNNLIVGTNFADQLFGLNGNDVLNGLGGNDQILGGNGHDRIIGGQGDDRLFGGNGHDSLRGGQGNDRLLGENGQDSLLGGQGNDKLLGGSGADYLNGGDGDDVLMAGNDLAADILIGGNGIDTVSYAQATGYVTAYLRSNFSGGEALGDSYASDIENVTGSSFDDFLQCGLNGIAKGGEGNDVLFGAFGNDRLRGDEGNDTLRMDYGDTAAWVQLGKGTDDIQYFVEGSDTLFIDLSEFGLGTTFDSSEIINSNTVTALGTNAQFIYEDDAKNLWFDSNGTGAGGLTLIATFTAATITANNLGTNDFEFML